MNWLHIALGAFVVLSAVIVVVVAVAQGKTDEERLALYHGAKGQGR